ncbi:MAG: thioredoxin family protein [Burkholderiales bacterium]|jgi:thiol-disulfide isomerase/thioredoxin|nr:thioredoxin family protein [Burkholderiales bacterium]
MTCHDNDNHFLEHPAVYFAKHWMALQKHRRSLAQSIQSQPLLAVCLCAEWCAVCRDFKPEYHALAQQHPETLFAYLDIEDDEALTGALELDNFPALAVFRDDTLIHFSVTKAKRDNIARLLRKLIASPPQPLMPPLALLPLCDAVCRGADIVARTSEAPSGKHFSGAKHR